MTDTSLDAIRFRLSYKRALGEPLTALESADLKHAIDELERRQPDADKEYWDRVKATNDALETLLTKKCPICLAETLSR